MVSRNPNGRPKGAPNRATTMAKEAIGRFVDDNSERFQEWLDKVANGVQAADGSYIVKPDPAGAFNMVKDVIEYYIPKLNRTDIQNLDKDGLPADNKITVEFVGKD